MTSNLPSWIAIHESIRNLKTHSLPLPFVRNFNSLTNKMCHKFLKVYHCYECQNEYHEEEVLLPCFNVSNDLPCDKVTTKHTAINHETCQTCQDARRAEEICQQQIYRMKPLYFNTQKRKDIREAYW